jgi:hypothetical protein
MTWYCYSCGKTQATEVECRCEAQQRMFRWLREMLTKLIYDISPEPFPFFISKLDPDAPIVEVNGG